MLRRIFCSLGLLLFAAAAASAQVNVRGQILLPNGDVPSTQIRFYLSSDDGRVNEYRFTDSNGRFILERLSPMISYTITVETDGSIYDRTVYTFLPSYQPTPRVTLAPLAHKAQPGSTISVSSTFRPGGDARQFHEKAMKEIDKEQLEAAEKHLRQAIALEPRFVDAMNDLGVLLMNQKRYAEAGEVLRQGYEADPKSVHLLLNLGINLNHLGKHAEAAPYLREALRLQPGMLAAHLHLGIALVETDQFSEAERHLLRAVRDEGKEGIGAQLYLGKLYARTGEFTKGIAALELYLQKVPQAANAEEVRELIARMKREMSARR
jgi:predicted Zn-dependent protease